MQKLVYIFFLLLAVSLLPGCRSAKEIHHYDTLTIERSVVHEVIKHDTLTIDTSKERIVTRTLFDTLQRVKEVVKVEYRDRYLTASGSRDVEVVHDTITVQQSSKTDEKKTPKSSGLPIFAVALMVGIIIVVIYKIRK